MVHVVMIDIGIVMIVMMVVILLVLVLFSTELITIGTMVEEVVLIIGALTLLVPVVLLNSPNLSPYFSLSKFETILLLIFSSLLLFDRFSFSHYIIVLFCMCYVRRSWVLITDWD